MVRKEMARTSSTVELASRRPKRSESEGGRTFRKTLQIATIGEDSGGVLSGVRNAPANKLVLICYEREKDAARRLSMSITDTLKTEVEVYDTIRPDHCYK